MSLDTLLPPSLFDLDDAVDETPVDTRDVPAYTGPRWDTIPCHSCGAPLTRWMARNTANLENGWYRWQLMAPAWDHLRAHTAGRLLHQETRAVA